MADVISEVVNEYKKFYIVYSFDRCSVGQAWTTVWLILHQMESRSLNRKFIIEDCWVRNMFSRSNMDYCLTHVTSDKRNDYVQKFHDQGLMCQKYIQ